MSPRVKLFPGAYYLMTMTGGITSIHYDGFSSNPLFTIQTKYFTSSDPHHDISKQLVDTTFV